MAASSSHSIENELKDHPFQLLKKPGPRGAYEARQTNGGLYVRVDMPGVPPDGVKLFKRGETRTVTFTGKAPNAWPEFDAPDRVYGGYVVLDRNPDEVDVEMTVVNGSLKLFFPNSEGLLHFCTHTTRVSQPYRDQKNEESADELDDSFRLCPDINPYVLQGILGIYENRLVVDATHGECRYIRVDMPGLGEKDTVVMVKDGVSLKHGGEGPKEYHLDEGGRSYVGRVEFDCDCCKMIVVKHEMKHGVLRVLFRKHTKPGSSGRYCKVGIQSQLPMC